MITKMKKLTFLIHNGEYEQFLEQLRALGVAHVIQTQQGAVLDTALNASVPLRTPCLQACERSRFLSNPRPRIIFRPVQTHRQTRVCFSRLVFWPRPKTSSSVSKGSDRMGGCRSIHVSRDPENLSQL